MPTEDILLVGAGGHAWVVFDALLSDTARRASVRIFDENPARVGSAVLGLTVEKWSDAIETKGKSFHVSVGDNRGRAMLFERLQRAGAMPRTVLHPASIVAKSASVDTGTFVAARAIVAPAATVKQGCIINHGAIVDHECRVGAFCHIAPNATLGGCVTLEDAVFLGAGVNVLPGLMIGRGATVGAGAVVTVNVPADTTYVGVPARRIR
jgi:sugar O-acyltransferase (sialic acid O-acetyltransferase NeuD family)